MLEYMSLLLGTMPLDTPENEYVLKWMECVIKSLSGVSMT